MRCRWKRVPSRNVDTVLAATPTRCRIDLEGWPAEHASQVWSDRRRHPLRADFTELGELLAQLVDDPAEVTLVIPISMPDAVQRREPEVQYTADRGSGFVSARTMDLPGGHIDVILNPGWLHALCDDAARLDAQERIRRTLVHEAQHVIMGQRKSGFDEYAFAAEHRATDRHFAYYAAKLCDEHRAEWQANQLTAPESTTVSHVSDVLETLGRQIAAAHDAYQADPRKLDAVRNLLTNVFTACIHYWTSLGYWTAYHRTSDLDIAGIADEIAALPLWQRYAGNTWALLQESLRGLPVEDLTTSPETLSAAMRQVAVTLKSSLETIGFRYVDEGAGQGFYITRFDFPAS